MEKQLDNAFSILANDYYKDIKSILCKQDSYKEDANVKAAIQIINYIENNVENNYDRLGAIESFICEVTDSNLIDALLPFRFLTNDSYEQIYERIEICDELCECMVRVKSVR